MIDGERRIDGGGIYPAEGKRLALVVGVNASIKVVHKEQLKYAENDAYEVARVLESSACNFTLPQPALRGEKATSNNVKDAIVELIEESKSKRQDFLCFYFSGHAQSMKVKGDYEDIYLVTHDFSESQVEIDPTRHLSMRWLWEVFYQQTDVGKMLLILDCCHAGNMHTTGSDLSHIDIHQLIQDYSQKKDAKKQTDRSHFILSATGYDAAAYDGIMTKFLLKALRGEAGSIYDAEGYLDVYDLHKYLRDNMPPVQQPGLSGFNKEKCLLAWYRPLPQTSDGGEPKTTKRIDVVDVLTGINNETSLLSFDDTLCRNAPLTVIDEEAVRGFFHKERVQKQPGFRPIMTSQELLEHFSLLREGVPTRAAILCFGKDPSKSIPWAFIRCTSWKGNDRLEDPKKDQFFRGNLLEQYWLSVEFLKRNLYQLPGIGAAGNIKQEEIPIEVLQEVLANALIHREYENPGNYVRVEIFDDRIEISSPGGLPDDLAIPQLGRETNYPIRNLRIAYVFYLYGYAQTYGTGISRILQKMQEKQMPPPDFNTSNGRAFSVVLHRSQPARLDSTIAATVPLDNLGVFAGVPPMSIPAGQPVSASPVLASPVQESVVQPAPAILEPVKYNNGKINYKVVSAFLSVILVILLLFTIFSRFSPGTLAFFLPHPGNTPNNTMGIGIINEPNNEQIGLSDGTYAFDVGTDRVDASLKTQAAAKFAQGHKIEATSLWRLAVGKTGNDTSDAEALIYLEDQRVLASGLPYLTLVVGTTLTGSASNISTGRDDMQGAYVEQKEYNDNLIKEYNDNLIKMSGRKLIRLLVANAGSKVDYVTEVAGQIIQAAKQDPTIVGVMGWPFSAYAQNAVPVLAEAHIPMVSPSASADTLTGISPYFYRVVPSNKSQAIAGAKYAEQQLKARRVALFVDPNNNYTSSLAADFKQQFVNLDGNQIVDIENYTVGDKADLPADLQRALKSNPDLIYFAGYADDVAVLLVNLPTLQPNLQVLGGDGFYLPSAYPSSAKPGFSNLRFTAFAYPDEWDILGLDKPPFFSDYSADFNPAGADHGTNPYGFTRADYGVILAYDATYALLQGCQNVLTAQNTLTPGALRNGLAQITGKKNIQGVGGQISFGSDGDPIDKAVVILYVDQDGFIHLLQPNGVRGCFALGRC